MQLLYPFFQRPDLLSCFVFLESLNLVGAPKSVIEVLDFILQLFEIGLSLLLLIVDLPDSVDLVIVGALKVLDFLGHFHQDFSVLQL